MQSGFNNFLKVYLAALGRPIPILTLALGIFISVIFPPVSLALIPLSLVFSLISAWFEANNPDFIKQTLAVSSSKMESIKSIDRLLELVNKQAAKSSFEEVKFDLVRARQNLSKIQEILKYLDSTGQSFDSFVLESLNKMVTQLIDLSLQEELARKFLKTENAMETNSQITALEKQIATVSDKIAKKEYEKVLLSKKKQLELVQSVGQRLERIDSYLARILSSMEQTHSYLTKVGLKDKQELVDESEVLTNSLQSVVSDIEMFEQEMLEVGSRLDTVQEQKPTQKISS